MRRLLGIGIVALFACTGVAEAQTCRGRVAVGNNARGMVELSSMFSKSTTGLSGGVGGGADTWFAGGGAGFSRLQDFDVSAWGVNFIAGGQVAADATRRVVICPLATVGYERASDILGTGINLSNITTNGGVAVGAIVSQTATVGVVPYAAFLISNSQTTLSDGVTSGSDQETFGILRVGVGLVFGKSSITPEIAVPIAQDGGETAFAITYAFSFARR